MSDTIINAAEELERRFKEKAATDRELRKLQGEVDQAEIKISEIYDRAALEAGQIKSIKANHQAQMRSREKWLRASVAHELRAKLGIATIPGYVSPIDKLREERRRLAVSRKKKEDTLTTAE